MTDVRDPAETREEAAAGREAAAPSPENPRGLLITRRGALVGGALSLAATFAIACSTLPKHKVFPFHGPAD